jgi:Flp pilus assembly protein TadD
MLCLAFAAARAFAVRAANGGGSSGAERVVRERIRIHPQCPRAHLAYAQLLAEMGREGEARRELREAERLQPGLSFASPATVDDLARKLGMSQQLPKQSRFHF